MIVFLKPDRDARTYRLSTLKTYLKPWPDHALFVFPPLRAISTRQCALPPSAAWTDCIYSRLIHLLCRSAAAYVDGWAASELHPSHRLDSKNLMTVTSIGETVVADRAADRSGSTPEFIRSSVGGLKFLR